MSSVPWYLDVFRQAADMIEDGTLELKSGEKEKCYCNQCKYYMGVRGVKGHAPCSKWGIGGVLWNDSCIQFEELKEGDRE